MNEAEYFELLRWALPRVGLRYRAFRRVKRQVCRRVRLRARELGLTQASAYRAYLEQHPDEWPAFEALCGVTISRFYRDRPVFDALASAVLPAIARELGPGETLRVWSAGCASGEEPYSVALIWQLRVAADFPGRELRVLGTDRDPQLLERAAAARYRPSSLRELPAEWIERSFTSTGEHRCLRPELRHDVTFECRDLRRALPDGRFQLILCRNLAFSYFEPAEQRRVLQQMLERLTPHGHLVIGLHETLPEDSGLEPVAESPYIYRRFRPSA